MAVETTATEIPTWEQRFRAPTVWLPAWSPDAPDRLIFSSNEGGSWQLWTWDRATGERRRLTDDPVGLFDGSPTPDGSGVVWFLDDTGDEYGHHVVAPYEGGGTEPLVTGIPDGWPAGSAMRGGVVAVAQGERDGFAVYAAIDGEPARELYRHDDMLALGGGGEIGGFNTGGLSADGHLLVFAHSEHGDPLHPALRVLDVRTGATVADLWDGEGRGLAAARWSPVPGDQRLAVIHERDDLQRPAIWDPTTGERTDLRIDVPGAVPDVWDWYPDADAILVSASHDGRDRLLRVEVPGGAVTQLDDIGVVSDARIRPDGEVWIRSSDGGSSARVRNLAGDVVLAPDADPAPAGRPYESWEFRNPKGQRVHGFFVRPEGAGPFPLVLDIHGGPTWQWYDEFSAGVQSWVDAGCAVALINYRGSTGYGAAWRDEINGNPGFTELEDIMAGLDDLIAAGVADPARVVIAGDSWGGYLTLLGIGMHPGRWAAAVAGVPVADYVAAYEDEAPSLQAMDRGLFGTGPEEAHAMYEERSPITYVDSVDTPLLILAGENDSRCPIRQIDNYLAAMAERGKPVEVYRYETGHSSYVVEERIRQQRERLRFVARHVDGVDPG